MDKEIEKYKQLLDILLDEVNVKEIKLDLADSEKGRITLVYNKARREFYYEVNQEEYPVKPSFRWRIFGGYRNTGRKYFAYFGANNAGRKSRNNPK